MRTARPRRLRVVKVGVTAALTLAASGITAAASSAAYAETPICEEVTVWTFATPTITTFPRCVTSEGLPVSCSTPFFNFVPWGGVSTELCVVD